LGAIAVVRADAFTKIERYKQVRKERSQRNAMENKQRNPARQHLS
jgi:hypothetical protein